MIDNLLENLLDNMDVGMIVVNNLGEISMFNEKSKTIFNLDMSKNKYLKEIIPSLNIEDIHGIEEYITKKHKDKIIIDNKVLNIHSIPIKKADIKSGYMLLIYDITELAELNNEINKERSTIRILNYTLEMAYDGIIVIDKDGIVTMINKSYTEFLEIDQDWAIGRHVTEVIENTRMHIVAKTRIQETAQLQKIKGRYMIATRIPVIENGELVAVIGKILFKNVKELDLLYNKIRNIEDEYKKYKGEFEHSNSASYCFDNLIGNSKSFTQAKKLAKKSAQTDSNVLLRGESGTGKELFAHAIHRASERAYANFVKVNCAAIPIDLLEAELFGYEGGSFTGARKEGKMGKFELANEGSIFLDEIGDMPLHMQAKLLRVLQEKEVERVGSTRTKKIDVRIIAATNRNLEEMIKEGTFREDLYYRLNVVTINIPPLRERPEDVEILSNYLTEKVSTKLNKKIKGLSKDAVHCLMNYKWEGGVRQLENVIERAINLVGYEKLIEPNHLPKEITESKYEFENISLNDIVNEAEKDAILKALIACNWNKSMVAKKLNISRTSLYEKIEKHRILI
ncbi:sigma 54-interacting transcriptional regulator [Clostridium sp. MSJ-11]|uniref:Sigma 54-interacting transcriptional regulator n=1 Tax=Clostridium mobile TaxID=2841512 RepID=A0ABS6ELW1_9CLOT|nr:sigma 54-interacting transcriptional regulator [Clostridium mobile]MBU5485651.1 sigma 54-interacting transcriptional regulator [Clostridium mobile]